MRHRRRNAAGFTLVELGMVMLLMAVLTALVLPTMNPGIYQKLQQAAQVVVGDLDRARTLAMTNNGTYRVTFDLPNNQYYLTYTGTNPALTVLPSSAFYCTSDTPQQQYTRLNDLPVAGGSVLLAAVGTAGSNPAPQTQIEFGPYGQTTQTVETDIWLTAGVGSAQRYLWISVNPITGLVNVETYGATPPSSSIVSGS
jgi:type II secretory pathway pseudopilin PulG